MPDFFGISPESLEPGVEVHDFPRPALGPFDWGLARDGYPPVKGFSFVTRGTTVSLRGKAFLADDDLWLVAFVPKRTRRSGERRHAAPPLRQKPTSVRSTPPPHAMTCVPSSCLAPLPREMGEGANVCLREPEARARGHTKSASTEAADKEETRPGKDVTMYSGLDFIQEIVSRLRLKGTSKGGIAVGDGGPDGAVKRLPYGDGVDAQRGEQMPLCGKAKEGETAQRWETRDRNCECARLAVPPASTNKETEKLSTLSSALKGLERSRASPESEGGDVAKVEQGKRRPDRDEASEAHATWIG
ncbi:hypothetical protein BESB_047550 [Besnoitia besnoiti]|uniref:Uncharacterized protein n=1 Tax=Besnoitia besnoiti TaxID=94643 RepID=A0A2A9MLI7_BESBE|nr:hypothetical protein BESB_047550 [Besnoitia besnoiti]PFH36563.1 hypothetical protein BESB_047550 [Besnoitia besnoiti]